MYYVGGGYGKTLVISSNANLRISPLPSSSFQQLLFPALGLTTVH